MEAVSSQFVEIAEVMTSSSLLRQNCLPVLFRREGNEILCGTHLSQSAFTLSFISFKLRGSFGGIT